MSKSLEELKRECDFNDKFIHLIPNPDKKFIELMLNRMIVGFTKYGSWKKNRVEVDAVANAWVRINKYLDTGNTEWLIDAANFFMMEFTIPLRQDSHYSLQLAMNMGLSALGTVKILTDEYKQTGNLGWLPLATDFLIVEWRNPTHKDAHFKGTDSHDAPPLAKF